jgi:hypothetical protein
LEETYESHSAVNFCHCILFVVFEGLFVSQFDGDSTPIMASPGSPFFTFVGCSADAEVCEGTASQCKSFTTTNPTSVNIALILIFRYPFLQGWNQVSRIFQLTTLSGVLSI